MIVYDSRICAIISYVSDILGKALSPAIACHSTKHPNQPTLARRCGANETNGQSWPCAICLMAP